MKNETEVREMIKKLRTEEKVLKAQCSPHNEYLYGSIAGFAQSQAFEALKQTQIEINLLLWVLGDN